MRTLVRNVPLARAWSPPPSVPGLAARSVRPPSTWILSFTWASGSIVRLSTKSLPVVAGHHAPGIAPLGKYKNAVRSGAPVAVVAAAAGAAPDAVAPSRRDEKPSIAGNARHTPTLRRKRRRLRES